MNIVIAADKKYMKIFKDSLTRHNILGFENELKSNFVSKIADHYNPHILIVVGGVRCRKTDFFDILPELRNRCPTMRIIYFFGRRLTDETQRNYIEVCEKMFRYGYNEVVPYDMYERGLQTKLEEIIETPLTPEDIKKIIADRQEEKIHTETLVHNIDRIIDTTPVSFDKAEVEAEYDDTKIIRYDEPPERLTEKQSEHITVAVGTISEKQAGCTMTALEIAFLLLKQKQSVAVFLEDETYERYIGYHGINYAPNGCQVNDLTLFPLSVYAEKREFIKFSVCDVGFAPIVTEDAAYPIFENAPIKICICSFNEWDVSILADYLNSPLPYIKDINYIFFPVSQETFSKFNQQMTKGHCKAFRTRNSPSYTKPCEFNVDTYSRILNKYIDIQIKKKHKRVLGLF